MPLHQAHAAIAIVPSGEHRVRVRFSMDYRMKYGPFGWLMGQTLLKMMMGRVLADNPRALAAKAEPNPNAQTQTV